MIIKLIKLFSQELPLLSNIVTIIAILSPISYVIGKVYLLILKSVNKRKLTPLEINNLKGIRNLMMNLNNSMNFSVNDDDTKKLDLDSVEKSNYVNLGFYKLTGGLDKYYEKSSEYLYSILKKEMKAPNYKNLMQAVKKNKYRVALLGEPGTGKSFSARNFIIDMVKDTLAGKQKLFPIYINLKEWIITDEKRLTFGEYLEKIFLEYDCYAIFRNNLLINYINNSVFILDSVDELPRNPEIYKKCIEEISNWILANDSKVIVTCRLHNYYEQLPLNKIMIDAFNNSKIEKYIRTRFKKNKKEVYSLITSKSLIYNFCSNPFILSCICDYIEETNNKNIFKNNQTISDILLSVFCNKIAKQYTAEEIKQYNIDKTKDFSNKLSNLAYILQVVKNQSAISIDDPEIMYLKEDDILIEKYVKSGIINKSKEGLISFSHERIKEYFAALYLSENKITLEEKYINNIQWKQTILFLVQFPKNTKALGNLITSIQSSKDNLYHYEYKYRCLLAYECLCLVQHNSDIIKLAKQKLYKKILDTFVEDYELIDVINVLKFNITDDKCKDVLYNFINNFTGAVRVEAVRTIIENTDKLSKTWSIPYLLFIIFRDSGYLIYSKILFISIIKIKPISLKKIISLIVFCAFFILLSMTAINIFVQTFIFSFPNLFRLFLGETYNIGYIFQLIAAPIILIAIILNFRYYVSLLNMPIAILLLLNIFVFTHFSTSVIFWLLWIICSIFATKNKYKLISYISITLICTFYDKYILIFVNSYYMFIISSIIWAVTMVLACLYFYFLPHIKWNIIKRKLYTQLKQNNGVISYHLLNFILDNVTGDISNDKMFSFILKYIKKLPLSQQLQLLQQYYKTLIERKISEEALKSRVINQIKMVEKELLTPTAKNVENKESQNEFVLK